MKLTVVGCSDAFGTGGRLQTCFYVEAWGTRFLIDCGDTALIGLDRLGVDPNDISAIFITHLHGDHFGGLIWWLIHANHISKRTQPMTIAGPVGLQQRFEQAAEALYPGCTKTTRNFELNFVEFTPEQALTVSGVRVTPFEVLHPSGAPPYALRFEVEGKTVTFSGDTEWVDSLIPASDKADLFITECYGYDQQAKAHLDWRTIEKNLGRITAKKIMLTHMGAAMLENVEKIDNERILAAWDGMTLNI